MHKKTSVPINININKKLRLSFACAGVAGEQAASVRHGGCQRGPHLPAGGGVRRSEAEWAGPRGLLPLHRGLHGAQVHLLRHPVTAAGGSTRETGEGIGMAMSAGRGSGMGVVCKRSSLGVREFWYDVVDAGSTEGHCRSLLVPGLIPGSNSDASHRL